jgi:hypothetical protein
MLVKVFLLLYFSAAAAVEVIIHSCNSSFGGLSEADGLANSSLHSPEKKEEEEKGKEGLDKAQNQFQSASAFLAHSSSAEEQKAEVLSSKSKFDRCETY